MAMDTPTREQLIGFAQRSADDAWLNGNTHTAMMFAAIADALAHDDALVSKWKRRAKAFRQGRIDEITNRIKADLALALVKHRT